MYDDLFIKNMFLYNIYLLTLLLFGVLSLHPFTIVALFVLFLRAGSRC